MPSVLKFKCEHLLPYESNVILSCCESEVAQSCPTLRDPVDCSLPGFSSMGFSRQEYWRELPFPSPGDLPNRGTEPGSPALEADALTSEPPGKPYVIMPSVLKFKCEHLV